MHGENPDPRWATLLSIGHQCAACGKLHRGLFDLGLDHPDPWPGDPIPRSNGDVTCGGDVLTQDFCISEGSYFVRAVLPIPLIGTNETFAYGAWTTLAEKDFWKYVDTFDAGDQGGLGPWFGWFAHRLKGYPDTANMKCQVHPREGRQRPLIELEPTDNLLSVEARQGISFDRLLDIYALNGHDLRGKLVS